MYRWTVSYPDMVQLETFLVTYLSRLNNDNINISNRYYFLDRIILSLGRTIGIGHLFPFCAAWLWRSPTFSLSVGFLPLKKLRKIRLQSECTDFKGVIPLASINIIFLILTDKSQCNYLQHPVAGMQKRNQHLYDANISYFRHKRGNGYCRHHPPDSR